MSDETKNPCAQNPKPTAPKPKRVRRPRPLTAEQLWQKVLRPMSKLQDRLKAARGPDVELGCFCDDLEKLVRRMWQVRGARELGEAKAKSKGRVLWTVFHPREVAGTASCFDKRRVAIRTPHTVLIKGEYWSIPDTERLAPNDPWKALDEELHRAPFNLTQFLAHAAMVDRSWRDYLQRGGPEQHTQEAA